MTAQTLPALEEGRLPEAGLAADEEASSQGPYVVRRNCSDLAFTLRIPCIIQESFAHGLSLRDFKIEAKYIVAIWAAVYGIGLVGQVVICSCLQRAKLPSRTQRHPDLEPPAHAEPRGGCQVLPPATPRLWDPDVAERSLRGLRLRHALLRLAGARTCALAALAVLVGWALTCVLTALAVERLLACAALEEGAWRLDPGARFNPVFQALQVICSFTVLPLGSLGARLFIKHIERRLGAQLSVFVVTLLHAKALRLPAYMARGGRDGVERLLAGAAADTLGHLPSSLASALAAPLFTSALFVLLSRRLGSALGTAVACTLPATALLVLAAAGLRGAQRRLRHAEGARTALVREALSGVVALQSYGWEDVSMRRVMRAHRAAERHLVVHSLLACLAAALVLSLPKAAAFGALVKLDALRGAPGPHTLFACLLLLESVVMALRSFEHDVARLASALSLCWRIEDFLGLPEAPDRLTCLPAGSAGGDQPTLRLQGSFGWSPGSGDVLHGLDIAVPHGALVAVVGEASAGKSALLHALLGELYPSSDGALAQGPVRAAFCGQRPWADGETLRQGVLGALGGGAPGERYRRALEAAALHEEAAAWPQGDLTPLGAVRSPGLLARVALARVAFDSSGLVLLDDPLRGVEEPAAAAALLQRYLAGPLLKNRTRVLAVRYLDSALLEAEFDRVIVVAGGHVLQQGKPADVLPTPAYQALCRTESVWAQSSPARSARPVVLASPVRPPPVQCPVDTEVSPWSSTEWCSGMHRVLLNMLPWRCLLLQFILAFSQAVCSLLADVQLAAWADDHSQGLEPVRGHAYLLQYGQWQLASCILFIASCSCGVVLAVVLSKEALSACLKRLLASPIDATLRGNLPLSAVATCLSDSLAVLQKLPVRCCWLAIASTQFTVQMAYIHSCVPLMMTFLMILMYFVIYWVGTMQVRRMVPRSHDADELPAGSLDAAIQMGVAVRAAKQLGAVRQVFSERLRRAAAQHQKARRTGISAWNEAFVVAAVAFIASLVPLAEVCLPGSIGVGTLGLCLLLLQLALLRLPAWLEEGGALSSDLASLWRLRELMELPVEQGAGGCGGGGACTQLGAQGGTGGVEACDHVAHSGAGTKVLLRDLVVAYAGSPDVLRGVSLAIEAGQRVCLLGPAGAGKTTLLLAVLQLLRPKGGHAVLSGPGATPTGPRTLRQGVGFVPAEPPLFLGTVRQNLDPGEVFADSEIMKVITDMQLNTCVASLPGGIDEWIDGDGGLSFEQQRMLCVARAALYRPGLLLVDSPKTSHDSNGRGCLRDLAITAACSAVQGATVLVAARRLEVSSANFDRFAVLQDGMVVETGPAEEACKARVLRKMMALRWPR